MFRIFIILITLMLAISASAAQWKLNDVGDVFITDESGEIARAIVGMHGPGWSYATSAGASVTRENDQLKTLMPLPANCTGELQTLMKTQDIAGGVMLDYNMSFTQTTEIQGAYVSVYIPVSRFAGKVALVPSQKQRQVLPVDQGQVNLGGISTGFAVELGDGKSFVVAVSGPLQLAVQDGRSWGGSEYEFRMHMFDKGKMIPGMEIDRKIYMAIIETGQEESYINTICPSTFFDTTRPYVMMSTRGQMQVGLAKDALMDINLAIHGLEWSYASQSMASVAVTGNATRRYVQGTLGVPGAGGGTMEFLQTIKAEPEALELSYNLSFPQATRLNGYQASFLPFIKQYKGATITLTGPQGEEQAKIGEVSQGATIWEGEVTRVKVTGGKGPDFELNVDVPSALLVQDNREWSGDTVELRFNFRRSENGNDIPAGETVERKFSLTVEGGLQVVLDENMATVDNDTANWIPYTLPWDSAPVDVSFLNHKPSGKFGYVAVKDGKYILSDTGEEIRFWGTCFSAGANFPSHEQAEKIAKRLAAFGVNIVRTHHADAHWAERHFFPKDADNTRSFDAENLDRFDYLMYCLKQEGIYVYLDQLVNRTFKSGDGVDSVNELGVCGKPYSNYDPQLIELQKEFSKNIWTHVNPYTGLAYKDDPTIALMEFANENDLFAMQVTLEPYRSRFETMYRDWAVKNDITLPDGKIDFQVKTDPMMRFIEEVQRNYYAEMTRYLRDEVRVKIPMTGSNWSINAALIAALRDMPYTDTHVYWNHPSEDGTINNTLMTRDGNAGYFNAVAFQKVPGKPLFISEWDEPWPNEWRAEGPCWMAAMSAFQGWNGLTVYTYRHSSAVPVDNLTGAFETFNDPARFGLFPAAALLYRRGDVAPAKEKWALYWPEELAISAASPTPWRPSLHQQAELHHIATAVIDKPDNYDQIFEADEKLPELGDMRISDTGELRRDVKKGVVTLDTPKSQFISGLVGNAGDLMTSNLRVQATTNFATIALSSLNEKSIGQTNRLLLTAVGRAENTGLRYNIMHNKVISQGKGPIVIEPVQATIEIQTDQEDLQVYAIGNDGKIISVVPSQWEDERLRFTIGQGCQTMYYEIY